MSKQKFAFLSDFDGTLSTKDFYHIIIDKYLKEEGHSFYTQWKQTNKINVEFLNRIFGRMNLTQEEVYEEIKKIPLDPFAVGFIRLIQKNGGDFYLVSAGTSYYINKLLEHYNIKGVTVISMEGKYNNGGIIITPDEKSLFYSEVFGLDKSKVLESLKQQYEQIFFAGDSEPDLKAAIMADIAYAKGELTLLLKKENVAFTPVNTFEDIKNDLIQRGILNEHT